MHLVGQRERRQEASMIKIQILIGDALTVLRTMPSASVQCVVTSPPYFGLRDYGVDGQLGLEDSPDAYVAKMVEVFAEVRRVLRDDGTLWLNLGDSYGGVKGDNQGKKRTKDMEFGAASLVWKNNGTRHKNLVGMPWRLALAMQADGWYLRSDIIWAKPNPMPESVTDRPTKAHEYVFLLTKRARYFYDADAVREAGVNPGAPSERVTAGEKEQAADPRRFATRPVGRTCGSPERRNARTVWTIATQAFPEAHFATFPMELPARCTRAGTKEGDTVLDPFSGAGTTGLAAMRLGRNYIGIELNSEYAEMSRKRLAGDQPLFSTTQVSD